VEIIKRGFGLFFLIFFPQIYSEKGTEAHRFSMRLGLIVWSDRQVIMIRKLNERLKIPAEVLIREY
jgi:hypothetical protein